MFQREKESLTKSKEGTEEQHQQMMSRKCELSALPPGVKGEKSAGRSDHPTNLGRGKPASCGHANQETIDLDTDEEEPTVATARRTPKRHELGTSPNGSSWSAFTSAEQHTGPGIA